MAMRTEQLRHAANQRLLQLVDVAAFPIFQRQEDHWMCAASGEDFRRLLHDLETGEKLVLILAGDIEPAFEHVHIQGFTEAAWPGQEEALRTFEDILDQQRLIDIPSSRLAEVGEFAGAELRDMGVFGFHASRCAGMVEKSSLAHPALLAGDDDAELGEVVNAFFAEPGGVVVVIDLGDGGIGEGIEVGIFGDGFEFDQLGGEAGGFRAADEVGAAFAGFDVRFQAVVAAQGQQQAEDESVQENLGSLGGVVIRRDAFEKVIELALELRRVVRNKSLQERGVERG